MKIGNLNSVSKNNGTISSSETNHNFGVNLQYFPILLKSVIDDWGLKIRTERGNPFLNYYRELSLLTGRAESTLRSYTNENEPLTFPPLDMIVAICKATNNFTLLEFIGNLK